MVRSSARDSLFAPGVLKMQPSKLLGSEYPRWDVAELDAYGKRLAADAKRAAKKKKGGGGGGGEAGRRDDDGGDEWGWSRWRRSRQTRRLGRRIARRPERARERRRLPPGEGGTFDLRGEEA